MKDIHVRASARNRISDDKRVLRAEARLLAASEADAMTARRRLPHRRGAGALDIEHAGHRYRMQVGYFPDGAVGEVFLDAAKQNSTLDAFAADAAILLSLLLQHGPRRPRSGTRCGALPMARPQA
jgi:hypothetical protein